MIDGVANFLLCHLPGDGPDAAAVTQACRRHNLFIRDVCGMGSRLGRHALRIAVKGAADNRRILRTLEGSVRAIESAWQDARPIPRGGVNSAPKAQSRGRMPSD